jgi:hypothetical protein
MAMSSAELATAETAAAAKAPPAVLLLMAVSGSGKSTIALELRRVLGWKFHEGDDLHPPANVEKMRAGHPLDNADRLPWLQGRRALDRRSPRSARAGSHYLLEPQARLSRHHDRQSGWRAPHLPQG